MGPHRLAVDVAQVKAVREATKGHTDAWSPEELRQAVGRGRGQARNPDDSP
jgi:hypothetical protein